MKFSIKDFLSKCDQIGSFLQIWSHLLEKSLMESFIFCTVLVMNTSYHFTNIVLMKGFISWSKKFMNE